MSDLAHQLMQELQQLRFLHEQIVSGADKRELVLSRTNQAQKLVRRIETDLRAEFGLNSQDDIAKAIHEFNGQIGGKGTGV